MNYKFKVNEWCFCEFKLQQITDMEGDRVTSVSDGMSILCSSDLSDRCFPLDLKIKRITDAVAESYDLLHLKSKVNLNYPDLKRAFVSRWVEGCKVKDDEKYFSAWLASFRGFNNAIWDKINQTKDFEVEGVRLLR
jgi:hypothetical protein